MIAVKDAVIGRHGQMIERAAHGQYLQKAVLSGELLQRAAGEVVINAVPVVRLVKVEVPRFVPVFRVRVGPVLHPVQALLQRQKILRTIQVAAAHDHPHRRPLHQRARDMTQALRGDRALPRLPDREKDKTQVYILRHGVVSPDVLNLHQHLAVDGFHALQRPVRHFPAVFFDHRPSQQRRQQTQIRPLVWHHSCSSPLVSHCLRSLYRFAASRASADLIDNSGATGYDSCGLLLLT